MIEPWFILTCRYGGDIPGPTVDQIAHAIEEIYIENIPGFTKGDYEEHGCAFLRFGYDDGPMYVLDVARNGVVTLSEWADQDFNIPLHPERNMRGVTQEHALEMMILLSHGDIEALRQQPWED